MNIIFILFFSSSDDDPDYLSSGKYLNMKILFAKRVKSTKCNFEKIDILYHDYLTSFQFGFILFDESRHLLEINYMVV